MIHKLGSSIRIPEVWNFKFDIYYNKKKSSEIIFNKQFY